MNNTEFKKINKNSPTMKYAVKLLQQVIKDIKNGECSEQELSDAIVRFNPETNGYFKEENFVNYDKACDILGLGHNRNRLNEICKVYNIRNRKINNNYVGFPKDEILRLKTKVN